MNNTFQFFDKIFCINLQKRVDRWEKCIQIFQNLKIDKQVLHFNAVDLQNCKSVSQQNRGRCGCVQSHINLIFHAKEQNYKNILIFEDDIQMHKSANTIHNTLQNCITELPNDWEVFYLSANPLNHVSDSVINFSKNLCTVRYAFTTHAIAINHTIYDTIIQEYKKYDNNVNNIVNKLTNIDGFYMDFIHPRLKTYMPKQLLFTQRCNYSDIDYCDRDINNIIIETYKHNLILQE